ncbi:MAG: hypothetical protein WA964_10800 [Ilumatobacter sp.]
MLVVLLGTTVPTGSGSVAFAAAPATPADDEPIAPTDTVTEFYPESANLSDCVGLVEQPGCGSGSRGGWRQTAVFVVLFAGLGVILWRVSRGIKANRAVLDADIDADADRS